MNAVLPLRAGLPLLLLGGLTLPTGQPVAPPTETPQARPHGGMPVPPPPVDLLRIAADNRPLVAPGLQALAANRRLPFAEAPLQPARPLHAAFETGADQASAERCLAEAIYYEAGFEGAAGREAVAQVVLNRLRHPAFPRTVCGVVYQRQAGVCQFTFACDGSRSRKPALGAWEASLRDARRALEGHVAAYVGMATHYHADYVLPRWAPMLDKVAVVGRHVFYRWAGQAGRRSSFGASYEGVEGRGFASFSGTPAPPAPPMQRLRPMMRPRAEARRRAASSIPRPAGNPNSPPCPQPCHSNLPRHAVPPPGHDMKG